MNRAAFLILTYFFLFSCDDTQNRNSTKRQTVFKKIEVYYPETYRDTTIKDQYHDITVDDPYRWLEDEGSPSTRQWVKEQNSITRQYLDTIPFQKAIKKRLNALWDYERLNVPAKKGDFFYIMKNDGLQNQDVLYKMASLRDKGEIILNPNRFSADETASLGLYRFSKSGSLLAFQVSRGGSDWATIRVKDLESGTLLDDKVNWVKFSDISWYKDGFFYSRYAQPEKGEERSAKNEFHQVYYHKVGTNQEEDELIFADRYYAQRNFYTQTTSDESFLLLNVVESTSGNALYFRDLKSGSLDFTPIVSRYNNDFEVIDNIGTKLLVLTNYRASNKRLIQISTNNPEEVYWEELIPQGEDVLQNVQLLGNKLVATYLHNASSQIKVFDLDGDLIKTIKLPGLGTVTEVKGAKDNPIAYFSFTSFTEPQSIYELNLASLKTKAIFQPNIDFDSDDYVTKQVWYESYDGERIPMFVIHKKGIKLDGARPTLLYGYGGFDIPVVPIFNRTRLNLFPVVLENGGVCAIANIRGGGEFGKKWHQAGTKENKQNVFDDFQAGAEFLIANKYTSSKKLAIYGRSNGGLLVGACMVQRPDLYQVALPAVGVMDMLRYHKFTIGWAWATDYGVSDDPDDPKAFDYLYSYSPLHNIVPENYPATLVTTADHDDRVVPAHSYKFISELQARQQSRLPTLIRIESSAGHGAGKPTSKKIEEAADILSFMFYNMQEDILY